MRHEKLTGWDIKVEKIRITEPGENGHPVEVDGWNLVFTEVIPPTGNTVRWACGKDVRDYIVRELTGGVVLAGGEFPKI